MPKMKTRRSVAKRFKTTGTGKVKRHKAYRNHLLEKKSPKQKRNLRKSTTVHSTDEKRVLKGLGKS
jgi:large subunit ribosomal protein L35